MNEIAIRFSTGALHPKRRSLFCFARKMRLLRCSASSRPQCETEPEPVDPYRFRLSAYVARSNVRRNATLRLCIRRLSSYIKTPFLSGRKTIGDNYLH